jgi:hypothetical protein
MVLRKCTERELGAAEVVVAYIEKHALPLTLAAVHEFLVTAPVEIERRLATEQLSNVVDSAMKNDQAATLSFVVASSSVTLIPSLNVAPSSTSPTSSWPLHRRQRSWAASKSL